MFILMTISLGFLGHRAVMKNNTNADADSKTDTMATAMPLPVLWTGDCRVNCIELFVNINSNSYPDNC